MIEDSKIRVGISLGDRNGIGFEIILKTFEDKKIFDLVIPIVFANAENFIEQRQSLSFKTNIFSLKNIKKANEKTLSVIIGLLSGILGGLTTFYAPPIITFLISINLNKEFFIRTTATMYFFASIPLYSSMLYHGLGNYYDLIMSLVLVVPAIIGQFFGSKIRKKLSNEIFQKLILLILIMIGFSLLFKNLIYLII